MLGGVMTIRNDPVSEGQGFSLLSDLHLGSPHTDEDLIEEDLKTARKKKDRVVLNGDIYDLILPPDSKRFLPHVLHPRFQGCTDILNKVCDWSVDFFSPYADLIDFIGSGNHECHDRETEVLTERGWIYFRNLLEFDRLATVTPNLTVRYQRPSQVTCDYYDGTMYHITGDALDALVTPNHRMLYRKAGSRYKIGTAEELASHPTLSVHLPVLGYGVQEDLPVEDDYLRILAWIITDGCVSKDKQSIIIYQRESKHHLITEILDRLGVSYSIAKRDRDIKEVCGKVLLKHPEVSCEIYLHVGPVVNKLKQEFRHGKHVPVWIGQLSERQFEIFLSSCVDGDGSRCPSSPGCWMLYGERHILDPIQAYACTKGWRATISTYRGVHLRLNLTSTGDDCKITPSSITPVEYQGFVYCATVPNGTLITRRNGRVLVSGNSAVEKHHNFDPILYLVNGLNERLKSKRSKHRVKYGGYCGFAIYPIEKQRSFTIFYHHGFGGGSTLSGAASDLNKMLAQLEGVDLVWLGHKHQKLSGHVVRISPASRGDQPLTRDVRFVRTGAYLDSTRGQSQESVQDRGRQSIYSVDKGYPFAGLGGARVLLEKVRPLQLRVIQ